MSKRFGRNQRRRAREQVAALEQKLHLARHYLEESQWWAVRVPRAHRSHRTYFGGESCMNCGAMLGGKSASEPCKGAVE